MRGWSCLSTRIYIYALREKTRGEVKYIGRAVDPVNRLRCHITEAMTDYSVGPKAKWIKTVIESGGAIEMNVIEDCHYLFGDDRERYWINYYSTYGSLTNRGGVAPIRLYFEIPTDPQTGRRMNDEKLKKALADSKLAVFTKISGTRYCTYRSMLRTVSTDEDDFTPLISKFTENKTS